MYVAIRHVLGVGTVDLAAQSAKALLVDKSLERVHVCDQDVETQIKLVTCPGFGRDVRTGLFSTVRRSFDALLRLVYIPQSQVHDSWFMVSY